MDQPRSRRRRATQKDRKREETRGKLIAAAKRLFSEFGYDDVPVTEIAQEAGVTHSMINVYFGGKPGLLYEIVKANNAPQYEASLQIVHRGSPAPERLSDMLLLWTKADLSEPRLLAIMQSYSWVWPPEKETENAADRRRFKSLIADLVQEASSSGDVGDEISSETAAAAIFAIYTWGLRTAIFQSQTVEQCHAEIWSQVKLVLGRP